MTFMSNLIRVLRNGLQSGSDFPEGIHVIRYKTYDQAGNTATCKFTVHVEGKACASLDPWSLCTIQWFIP